MGTPVPHPGSTPDPSLRISDADRHKVVDFLQEAAGEGRLEISELEERIEATYQAKTYADLVPITVDLPVPSVQPPVVPLTKPAAMPGRPDLYAAHPVERSFHPCIMSGVERKGVWTVPASITVVALMGGAEFDMRQAQFSAHETVLYANAVMGGVNIIVGPEVHVVVEGVGVMGAFVGPRNETGATDGPVLRVKGLALMGGVNVERKLPKPPKAARKQLR